MGKFGIEGGNFAPLGYAKIEAGGSHDENPNGGVQVGIDENGVRNLLQEDETVMNDFVYSNEVIADADTLEEFGLPVSLAGKPYSYIADYYVDAASEMTNDAVANRGMNAMLVRAAKAQEAQKQKAEQAALEEQLANLSPDEVQALVQELEAGEAGVQDSAYAGVPNYSGEPVYARNGGFIRTFQNGGDGDLKYVTAHIQTSPATGAGYDVTLDMDKYFPDMTQPQAQEFINSLSPEDTKYFYDNGFLKPKKDITAAELLSPAGPIKAIRGAASAGKTAGKIVAEATKAFKEAKKAAEVTTKEAEAVATARAALQDAENFAEAASRISERGSSMTSILKSQFSAEKQRLVNLVQKRLSATEGSAQYKKLSKLVEESSQRINTLTDAIAANEKGLKASAETVARTSKEVDEAQKAFDKVNGKYTGAGKQPAAPKKPVEKTPAPTTAPKAPAAAEPEVAEATKTAWQKIRPWAIGSGIATGIGFGIDAINRGVQNHRELVAPPMFEDVPEREQTQSDFNWSTKEERCGGPIKTRKFSAGGYATLPMYAGVVGDGLIAMHNAFQKPDVYTSETYIPNLPSGTLSLDRMRYNPVDQDMLSNKVTSQGNAVMRGISSLGAGYAALPAMMAADNQITQNRGQALLNGRMYNDNLYNQAIGFNNSAAAQEANFNFQVDAHRAAERSRAQLQNIMQQLRLQQMNYASEQSKYNALGRSIENALKGVSNIGRQNFIANQHNSNTALYWKVDPFTGNYYFDPDAYLKSRKAEEETNDNA